MGMMVPLSLLLPCHAVLRKGNYQGNVQIKEDPTGMMRKRQGQGKFKGNVRGTLDWSVYQGLGTRCLLKEVLTKRCYILKFK